MNGLPLKPAAARLIRRCKELHRDASGATAVEFAILGPVFLSLIFSGLELGLILTKRALLDNAANKISKSVYIGSASSGAISKAELEEQVCDEIGLVDSNCEGNLTIELTTVSGYGSLPTTEVKCIDKDEKINPTVDFNGGGANSIMFMRICLTTQIFTPGMGFGLSFPKTDNGKVHIVTSLAFSNEPF